MEKTRFKQNEGHRNSGCLNLLVASFIFYPEDGGCMSVNLSQNAGRHHKMVRFLVITMRTLKSNSSVVDR
jgi:hypothetical protein